MKKSNLRVIDCNNFWSPSGGGVKRYHLEKINFFKKQDDIHYVFIMQDTKTYTEKINETTFIEHISALKIPGNWEYRYLLTSLPLIKVFKIHQPDIIEVGSPYIMPWIVQRGISKLKLKTKIVCFWHADFPVTYVRRFFEKWSISLAKIMESLAWAYANLTFRNVSTFFVSSSIIKKRMESKGLMPTTLIPLGVDTSLFSPNKKDLNKIQKIKSGNSSRLTLFFPHRFMEEKGLRTLLKAYPIICKKMNIHPAIVFAGTGPDLDWVLHAEKMYEHIHYLGYVTDRQEMASWYASCDLGLALSGYETFGLSILEGMASGQVMIGANTGAAFEHIQSAQVGLTIPTGDPDKLTNAIVHIDQLLREPNCTFKEKARLYAQKFKWSYCFEQEIKEYNRLITK